MKIDKYYDQKGCEHTVKTEWSFGCYRIYVDGEFYTNADDRLDVHETVTELIKYRNWSMSRPKKCKRNTPLVPASE